jgi:hypothetical protein
MKWLRRERPGIFNGPCRGMWEGGPNTQRLSSRCCKRLPGVQCPPLSSLTSAMGGDRPVGASYSSEVTPPWLRLPADQQLELRERVTVGRASSLEQRS